MAEAYRDGGCPATPGSKSKLSNRKRQESRTNRPRNICKGKCPWSRFQKVEHWVRDVAQLEK